MKVINDAVDKVRRQEQKDRPELFRTRYIWLKFLEKEIENSAAHMLRTMLNIPCKNPSQ